RPKRRSPPWERGPASPARARAPASGYSISLALPGGPGRLITMIESGLETKAKTMTRMRDIDPAIIRAQCAADPIKIAREILRAKVGAQTFAGGLPGIGKEIDD